MNRGVLLLCLSGVVLSLRPGAAVAPDIVLYAADASYLREMSIVPDSTAGGGFKLSSANNGWASTEQVAKPTTTPMAAFKFDVPHEGDYRVWLRLKGKDNSKWNESVWVQFDSATRAGMPVYSWTSPTDALLVNLENCSGCGIQEWGWQDNSWWLNQSSVVSLSAGRHHIYVSVREDGVELDQIVLSPERFFTQAPGPVRNDSTVLPRSTGERISIQQGRMSMSREGQASLTLRGTNGFAFDGGVLTDGSGYGAFTSCGRPCEPGLLTWLGFFATGTDIGGSHVSYRGATYDISMSGESTLALGVHGLVVTPPPGTVDGEEATAYAFFTVGEQFRYEGTPGQPTGQAMIVGGANGTITFWWSEHDGGWYFRRADFQFVNPTGLAPPSTSNEILLETRDAILIQGLNVVADSTAWGGQKISSENTGRQWLNAPPGTIAPYATFAFNVPETGDYRLWIRLKGQDNSKWNESVWVQFTNATRNGAPVYDWGSNDGLLVNLENCSGCGIQGWGWQDNAWWLNQSSLVTLSAGRHELYVALREDGVEFDQIVLSPARYLTTAPGPVKSDNTLVQE